MYGGIELQTKGDKIKYLEEKNRILNVLIYLSLFLTIFIVYSFIGSSLNASVMINNGGRMPVYNNQVDDNVHFGFMDYSTINNPSLVDKYRIKDTIYSLGDFIIYSGIFLMITNILIMIIYLIKYARLKKRFI
jgi:hypothetical protein